MKITRRFVAIVLPSLLLSACGTGGSHSDLRSYIEEVKAKPSGIIQPLPTFRPYEAFIYSAAAQRSPFDRPVDVQQRELTRSGKNVTPDFNREKEYLENFDLNSMGMVGTLKKGVNLWVLIKDDRGGVHRVKTGNYIGKNHGRIVATSATQLDLVEIVSDGLDGWVERPRVLALSEKE